MNMHYLCVVTKGMLRRMHKTMVMMAAALLATGACGKSGDECQQFYDKTAPIFLKMDGDKKMPADYKDKFLKECRDGDKMKSDPMFKCVVNASGEAAVNECMGKAFGDYTSKSKKTEAQLQLNKLGKNLKVFYITDATFPVGKTGPTPAEPCCKGEGGKCALVPMDKWMADEVWNKLEFMIDEPTRFQYAYESDGKTATATAVGDLDCDGTMITYKLEMTTVDGNPVMKIVEPPANSD